MDGPLSTKKKERIGIGSYDSYVQSVSKNLLLLELREQAFDP